MNLTFNELHCLVYDLLGLDDERLAAFCPAELTLVRQRPVVCWLLGEEHFSDDRVCGLLKPCRISHASMQ
jgi:hypothetical protein